MKKLLFIALTLMTFASCSKSDSGGSNSTPAPTVSFTYTRSSTSAPSNVSFTSTTTNATTYSWNFGDGTTSNVANPTHTYTSNGDFSVTLTVTGAGGSANATNIVNLTAPAIVYTKVSVTQLTIIDFPETKSDGSNWDGSLQGTFPDVYFQITKSGTTTSLYNLPVANRIENLRKVDLPKSWSKTDGTPFFILNDLTQAIDVDLYNYNSTSTDDYMGSTSFNFTNYTTGSNKYPTTVTTTKNLSPNRNVTIKLDLIWIP
jgi:PKD repeat protein